MRKTFLTFFTFLYLLYPSLNAEEPQTLTFEFPAASEEADGITVNFEDVSILEFLRFVSKIASANFIYDEKLLDFRISLVTGKSTHPDNILKIMIELLEQQGIKTENRGDYYLVEKMEEWEIADLKNRKKARSKSQLHYVNNKEGKNSLVPAVNNRGNFQIYKLKYHQGGEILETIKRIAADLKSYDGGSPDLLRTIGSMQWVQSTNSILYSGPEEGMLELNNLVQSLDVPQKQVFIEVLVIETDVRNGREFGLEWGGGGNYRNRFGYGTGNFPVTRGQAPFAKTMQQIDASNPPTGTSQFPIGRGFDLGVIGDIILHKGQSFFSLGTLVSALEAEGNSTIILNQKIITQDNKLSSVFVGDNIPFTGSVIETVGASQQTSANIEYRDVGVKLNITPLLGDNDVITLEISQEITEVINDMMLSTNTVGGIQTTKTDMMTQVHVPDNSFLILSGMIRNTKKYRKSAIPCLGGLPLVGAAFSKTKADGEKRNIIVFVRPQIVNSLSEYENITVYQQKEFQKESGDQKEFKRGIDMLKKEGHSYGTNQQRPANLHKLTTADAGDET